MKNLQVLSFILLLGLSLPGCNDDNNPEPDLKLEASFLKQTKWNGTITHYVDGKIDETENVSFYFITENRGEYDFGSYTYINIEFNYTLDEKLLNIQAKDKSVMSGDWILTDIKKDRLVFRMGLASDVKYFIMDLTKSDLWGRK